MSRLPCTLETELGLALPGDFYPCSPGSLNAPLQTEAWALIWGKAGGWVFNSL